MTAFSAWPAQTADALCAAAAAIGAARAQDGAELEAVRRELLAAAHAVGLPDPMTQRVADAVTVAWRESTTTLRHTAACVDPLTQLCSSAHLTARIDELRTTCAARGRDVALDYAIVMVQVRPAADRLTAETHMILVQQAMRAVFAQGQTLARVSAGCAAAVVRRTTLGRLRAVLELELELERDAGRLPESVVTVSHLPGSSQPGEASADLG